jgi:hypothetical protein
MPTDFLFLMLQFLGNRPMDYCFFYYESSNEINSETLGKLN